MKEFPKGGLIGKIMDAAKTVRQMHIPLHAAYAAYFIVLAVFPALVLILSVLRLREWRCGVWWSCWTTSCPVPWRREPRS